jgi:hypothetical protein
MNTKTELNLRIGKQLKKEGHEKASPFLYVVSREEYDSLKNEKALEVEGLSYEEYCALESECWHDMLSAQLATVVDSAFSKTFHRNQFRPIV